MQQANAYMYSSNSRQRKAFDEVHCCACKTLKTEKCLPKSLFSIEVLDLCLFPCICTFFKI